ncbi:hypothetical protein [Saccharopolyspora gregorii]
MPAMRPASGGHHGAAPAAARTALPGGAEHGVRLAARAAGAAS